MGTPELHFSAQTRHSGFCILCQGRRQWSILEVRDIGHKQSHSQVSRRSMKHVSGPGGSICNLHSLTCLQTLLIVAGAHCHNF